MSDSHPSSGLVVLTQNAWGGAPFWARRRKRLALAIADLEPDVIGLQEIHAPSTSGDESQAHELAADLGGYDVSFAPGRVTASGACEGVALLTRHGLETIGRTVLRLSLDPEDVVEGPHQRVVLSTTVRKGPVVDVMVTHLSLSKKARQRTLGEIVAFSAAERDRTQRAGAVLMGDFNATPVETSLSQLESEGGFRDAWEAANPQGTGATWPASVPFRRIDYIWVQPGAGWRVAECERLPVAGSDHVGLWARIEGAA